MRDFFISKGVWDMSLSRTNETKMINDIYDNWFIDEQTYQTYKSYHKNDNWTLKKYI